MSTGTAWPNLMQWRKPGLTVSVATDTIAVVKEPKTLGERLRAAREERGLGTNELNRLVRLPEGAPLSDGYISRIETGDRKAIQAVYANAIADALGVRGEWLISGTGPRRYESGEHPAVAPAQKPNLERVLEQMNRRGRWSVSTVAAATAQDVDVPLAEWPDVLDGIESGLAPLLKRLSR